MVQTHNVSDACKYIKERASHGSEDRTIRLPRRPRKKPDPDESDSDLDSEDGGHELWLLRQATAAGSQEGKKKRKRRERDTTTTDGGDESEEEDEEEDIRKANTLGMEATGNGVKRQL